MLESRIESSLLCTRVGEDGKEWQEFVHDTLRDYFLALHYAQQDVHALTIGGLHILLQVGKFMADDSSVGNMVLESLEERENSQMDQSLENQHLLGEVLMTAWGPYPELVIDYLKRKTSEDRYSPSVFYLLCQVKRRLPLVDDRLVEVLKSISEGNCGRRWCEWGKNSVLWPDIHDKP